MPSSLSHDGLEREQILYGAAVNPLFSPPSFFFALSLPSSTAHTLLLVSSGALSHPRSAAAGGIFHEQEIAHLKSH